jgi:Putative prokaryotic signal transducing protein
MIHRDSKCVHVDDNLGRARLVAGWLSGQGIPADVMDENTLGGFEGLVSILPDKLANRGVEVWVKDPADTEQARQLLAERAAEAEAKAQRTGIVEAVCEECGQTATFPAAEQGTIQDCPHCGAMIDVPDPDDDWDVGDPEDGDEA